MFFGSSGLPRSGPRGGGPAGGPGQLLTNILLCTSPGGKFKSTELLVADVLSVKAQWDAWRAQQLHRKTRGINATDFV